MLTVLLIGKHCKCTTSSRLTSLGKVTMPFSTNLIGYRITINENNLGWFETNFLLISHRTLRHQLCSNSSQLTPKEYCFNGMSSIKQFHSFGKLKDLQNKIVHQLTFHLFCWYRKTSLVDLIFIHSRLLISYSRSLHNLPIKHRNISNIYEEIIVLKKVELLLGATGLKFLEQIYHW